MRRYAIVLVLLLSRAASADQGMTDSLCGTDSVTGQQYSIYDTEFFAAQNLKGGGSIVSVAGTGEIINSPPAIATWTAANPRIYCLDGTSGNDALSGYADSVSSSPIDVRTATVACGAVAKKTVAGLVAIFPQQGAGRSVIVVVRSGTYNGLQAILQGTQGYARGTPLIRGTETNASAGVTAFDGTPADLIYVGAVTATNANPGGYSPIGSPTTTVVQLQKAGGGAAGLTAEAAGNAPSPDGYRWRCDVATVTAALRNVAYRVVKITGTDTVTLSNALPAVPTTSDLCYLEMPGVVTDTLSLGSQASQSLQGPQLVGVRTTGAVSLGPSQFYFDFCGVNSIATIGFSRLATVGNTGLYFYPDGTFPQVGGGIRVEQSSNFEVTQADLAGVVFGAGTPIARDVTRFSFRGGAVAANGLIVDHKGAQEDTSNISIGSGTGEPVSRIIGPTTVGFGGLELRWVDGVISNLDIVNMGAQPGVKLVSKNRITLGSTSPAAGTVTGSTGNTDVGLDLTTAYDSGIYLQALPTVTGTAGDVRLCDGSLITWAQANAGIVDACGNQFIGSAGEPITVLPAGTTIASLAGSGTSCVQASSTGLVSRTGSACGAGAGLFYQTIDNAGSAVTQRPAWNASTGLTAVDNSGATRTDVTANLSTGVSGGQSVIGGTAASDSLTISSTSNGTKGKDIFGSTSGMVFDESTGLLGIGVAPAQTLQIQRNVNGANAIFVSNSNAGGGAGASLYFGDSNTLAGGDYMALQVFGPGVGTLGPLLGARTAYWSYIGSGGSARLLFQNTSTDTVFSTGFSPAGGVAALTIKQSGQIQFPDGDLLLTAIVAPSTPSAGTGHFYEDSTSKNFALLNDAGTVNHGAQTKANSAGVALTALADNGSWTTQTFQAPLVACTDYVSLSCVTGATDLGGTNATPTVIGIEDAGKARGYIDWTARSVPANPTGTITREYNSLFGAGLVTLDSSGNARFMVPDHACGASNWVSSSGSGTLACTQPAFSDLSGSATCAQLPAFGGDLTSAGGTCSVQVQAIEETSGPARLAINAIPDLGSGNPAILNRPGGTGTVVGTSSVSLYGGPQGGSVSTNYVAYAPGVIGYGNWAIPYATHRTTADVQNAAMEVPVGFAAKKQRVLAWVTSNSLGSGGGGSSVTACQSTQNGVGTSVFAGGGGGIPNTSTGLFDSGITAVSSSAATDTWGLSCGGTSPLGGTINMTVTVVLYQ